MDTVERRKLANRLQILLENITHNGNFFYYDGYFALVMNNVSEEDKEEILSGMIQRTKKRMPEICMHVGVGNRVVDISLLHESYKRAKAAVLRAIHEEVDRIDFTKMNYNMTIAFLTDMVKNPANYENTVIKINGQYFKNDYKGQTYFFLMLRDPDGCSPSGIEFIPPEKSSFLKNPPKPYSRVQITGTVKKPENENTIVIYASKIVKLQ